MIRADVTRAAAARPRAVALLGLSLAGVERGCTACSTVADDLHAPPPGTMPDGIVATLVGTATGSAESSTRRARAGCTPFEVRTHFDRSITPATERVRAVGRVVHEDARYATNEARAYDDSETNDAHAKSTHPGERGARQ